METLKRFEIPIAKPFLGAEEVDLVKRVIETGWLIQGPMVKQFEESFAAYTGSRFAVAVSSCTSALHIGFLLHGIGSGDEVLCPSYSFIATANAIRHAGAEPQFIDIDPDTLNICPEKTEQYIEQNYDENLKNKQTGRLLKGILIVHQIGIPADIDRFNEIAEKRGIVVFEDSACAIGSTYKGNLIGASGNTSSFSFHPRKILTTGEGGMVTTDNEELAQQARVLREHGASVSPFSRHSASSTVFEDYAVVGYNYRMTDMQAALGIGQLNRLGDLLAKRDCIATKYNAAFSKIGALAIVTPAKYVSHWNYQSYPLRVREGGAGQRDALMRALQERGVATRRGIPPIHRQGAYGSSVVLPETEATSSASLFLPIYHTLTDEEVAYVISSVEESVKTLS